MRSDNSQTTLDLSTDGRAAALADPANPRVIAALEEYLRLCEEDAAPDPQTFTARYPDIRDTLSGALAGLRFMQDAAPQVEASSEGIARSFELNLSDLQPLGDFRILREIGRGGMGIVYEAQQMSLARRVALKVLPFAAVLDPRHLQRFKNEALAAASLDHPNIVEVYAVGCERGVHFYAMRYVEGQTLAAVISECGDLSPLSLSKDAASAESSIQFENQSCDKSPHSRDTVAAALSTLRTERPRDFFRTVAELGVQAAEALDHAHQLGIVHRDIKPSNLMIECSHLAQRSHLPGAPGRDEASMTRHAERDDYTPLTTDHWPLNTPHLYITDFGLARIESDATLTLTGDLLGTLRYMSPEQAEGRSAVLDHRTDIYSLGITLYELATLRPAFTTEDRQSLLRQIANDEPPPPRKLNNDIPADLETIILKSISKAVLDRYASAADLAADLASFAQQKPIAAHRLTVFERTARWSRRHSTLVLAACSVLLLLSAIAGAAAVLVGRAYQDKAAETARADRRSELARKVIDEMFTKVAMTWLANERQMTTMQREFLEKAAAAYEELLADEPDDSDLAYEYSKALGNLSATYRGLGRRADAERLVDRALAICERFASENPDNARYRNGLAADLQSKSVLQAERGDRQGAAASIERSIAIWRQLAESDASNPMYQTNRANALQNAALMVMKEQPALSMRMLLDAAAALDTLIEKFPLKPDYRLDAARVRVNLGVLIPCDLNPTQTVASLRRAIELLEPMQNEKAISTEARHMLAGAQLNLASVFRKIGQPENALPAAREALAVSRRLQTDFPLAPEFQSLVRDAEKVASILERAQ